MFDKRRSADRQDDTFELTFENVLQEEQEWLRRRRASGGDCGCEKGLESGGAPFSLAFSGGGVRAAAFQAGVLWRLAQAGRLKDVEYFTAVSGGAYIAAAFASHLVAAAPPEGSSETEVDTWYLNVVAQTITRMQRNAGGFVRDPCGNPFGFPKDGSGLLPRVFDVPILLLTLSLTLAVKPMQILLVYLVPITEAVQLFFGGALRAAFCAPTGADRTALLLNWSPYGVLIRLLEGLVSANFAVWVLSKTPPFRLGDPKEGERRRRTLGYLFAHGALAGLLRFSAILALTLLLLSIVPYLQIWEYNVNLDSNPSANMTRESSCLAYVRMQTHRRAGNKSDVGLPCANFYQGHAWYGDPLFTESYLGGVTTAATPAVDHVSNRPADLALLIGLHQALLTNSRSVMGMFFGVLLILLLVGVLLVPFDPHLLLAVLTFAGPAVALVLIVLFAQYRIYGPITNQSLFFEGWHQFDQNKWDTFVIVSLLSCVVLVPLYHHCQKIWHWYYLRTLQMNFFEGGRDRPFPDLGENRFCPFMMFTGTVNDFKRLGSHQNITEVSFSALHTGSSATGYLRTPNDRTLAKCTALTGAGCLDAISLSMSHRLRFRFLLEMLNLSWGDYILFHQREGRHTQRCARRAGKRWGPKVRWCLHQAPSLLLWLFVMVLLAVGWKLAKDAGNRECREAKYLVATSAGLLCSIFMLSFFSFQPGLEFLMFSPLIRQFHQVSRFYFRGLKPPGLLYVTDGGVQDCTCIVQLMRRRVRCILLVLAAADPDDDLGVLRAAMEVAVTEQLGSFFDLENPRRDVRILMEEYKKDKALTFFQFGIRYGWGNEQEGESTGLLLVVKNRLPPAIAGLPMQPLLTAEEIKGDEPEREECKACGGILARDLGGLGCCDFCHFYGCNCARKFPHLTGANYLYLTPLLFSNLCRLGHDISEEVVEVMLSHLNMEHLPAGASPLQRPAEPSSAAATQRCRSRRQEPSSPAVVGTLQHGAAEGRSPLAPQQIPPMTVWLPRSADDERLPLGAPERAHSDFVRPDHWLSL